MARGEIRPAGSRGSIECVRGFVREETDRRRERGQARAVRAGLEGVASRHERRRTAARIATSYGWTQAAENWELSISKGRHQQIWRSVAHRMAPPPYEAAPGPYQVVYRL